MAELSILIPARNEMFLKQTIDNILENIEGDTEIITVMDGYWADPPIPQHERVTIVHLNESIGQRAATNMAAKLSQAKYLMKVDAHCAFDKGFDVKMMEAIKGHDDWTMVPMMKNLHAFDWICPDGHRRYQGPSGPCQEKLTDGNVCGKETTRDILWFAKPSPRSVSYCFDSTPHFQYFGEFSRRSEGQGDITPSMSLQGSCFMCTREKYFELNLCDENFGSWGSQGIEVACKTWLSGGSVMVNKNTWYGHMFRTQGGDFGFPYPISVKDQEKAKKYARDLFFNNKWDKQVRPLSWLLEKFWPVPGWSEKDLEMVKNNSFEFKPAKVVTKTDEAEPLVDQMEGQKLTKSPTKGIIFYTDNQLKLKIAHTVQKNLRKIADSKGMKIVSSSLKPMSFGDRNVHFPHLKRGYLTMFKQILGALENSSSDIVFFCEHDVLYHPSHFDFTPPKKTKFYYNENVWKLNSENGHALHYDCKQVSGIAVYRDLAIKHYKKRIKMVEKDGFKMSMGFEPATHMRSARVDNLTSESWKSEFPNVDIRHGHNLSTTRWKKSDFRNQKFTKGWIEALEIPAWGKTEDLIKRFT